MFIPQHPTLIRNQIQARLKQLRIHRPHPRRFFRHRATSLWQSLLPL